MRDSIVLTIEALHERVEAIFSKAGLNPAQAGAITRAIVAGERDACKSHGIYRIEGALRTVKAGKAEPKAVPELLPQDAPAIVKVCERRLRQSGLRTGPARAGRADAGERPSGARDQQCRSFFGPLGRGRGVGSGGPCRPGHVSELCNGRTGGRL
jgi:hypothetical protein